MSKAAKRQTVHVRVGRRSLDEIGADFIGKWKALEAGEDIQEATIRFHSLEAKGIRCSYKTSMKT